MWMHYKNAILLWICIRCVRAFNNSYCELWRPMKRSSKWFNSLMKLHKANTPVKIAEDALVVVIQGNTVAFFSSKSIKVQSTLSVLVNAFLWCAREEMRSLGADMSSEELNFNRFEVPGTMGPILTKSVVTRPVLYISRRIKTAFDHLKF